MSWSGAALPDNLQPLPLQAAAWLDAAMKRATASKHCIQSSRQILSAASSGAGAAGFFFFWRTVLVKHFTLACWGSSSHMWPEMKLTAGSAQGEFTCCDTTNPSLQMKQLYGHQISGMFGARCARLVSHPRTFVLSVLQHACLGVSLTMHKCKFTETSGSPVLITRNWQGAIRKPAGNSESQIQSLLAA